MAIRNTSELISGERDWVFGEALETLDINDTFDAFVTFLEME